MRWISVVLGLVVSSLGAFAGCGGTAGDSGGNQSNGGTLALNVAGAPVNGADAVVVELAGVTLQTAGGERIEFDFATPQQIDLLALSGAKSLPVLHEEIPAGHYSWLRLKVNEGDVRDPISPLGSYITIDGQPNSLRTPSGDRDHLKLEQAFDVAPGGKADYTIGLDLSKSVRDFEAESQGYWLRPVLRMVDNNRAGRVEGTVAPALVRGTDCAVYLFDAASEVPGAGDGNARDPMARAAVTRVGEDPVYHYRIGFLSPGEYTIALTCDADEGSPDGDASETAAPNSFSVTVRANRSTSCDFE